LTLQEEIAKAVREEISKAALNRTGQGALQEEIAKAVQEEISKSASDYTEQRSLQREIGKVTTDLTGQRRRFFSLPLIGGVKNNGSFEMLKWLFFCFGIIGILVSSRFVSWVSNLNTSLLRNILGFFTIKIFGIPLITFASSGILIFACIIATLQKNEEILSRESAERTTNLLSELASDLGKGPKTVYVGKDVLSEISEVKNIISKLSLESNKLSAKKTVVPKVKTVVPKFDLSRINGIGPKTIKKLKKMGIMKTSDLLRVAPGNLADKTGISYKIITRWIKDATKLSKGSI